MLAMPGHRWSPVGRFHRSPQGGASTEFFGGLPGHLGEAEHGISEQIKKRCWCLKVKHGETHTFWASRQWETSGTPTVAKKERLRKPPGPRTAPHIHIHNISGCLGHHVSVQHIHIHGDRGPGTNTNEHVEKEGHALINLGCLGLWSTGTPWPHGWTHQKDWEPGKLVP